MDDDLGHPLSVAGAPPVLATTILDPGGKLQAAGAPCYNPAMGWIFGIDGGGTAARLRIEDEGGALLYYAEGGSTNPRSNDGKAVEAAVRGLFERAYAEAGISPSSCRAGFVGSAGVDRPADEAPFAGLVASAAGISAPVGAGNDSEPALAGALSDTEGYLLISGTGSIALARSREGRKVRAGGWGHLLGDEGSAYRIAFDGLARGIRSWEGRDLPSGLLDAGLAFFGLAEPFDLIPFVYEGFDKARIARFAREVGRARDSGDPLALDIFGEAALALAGLVDSVAARLGASIARQRLSFRGGLIEGDRRLREAVETFIHASRPDIAIVPAAEDSAAGACILARTLL
jgi:glucosamine kinase